jgi:dimeric dUTPase (all-alpha-NTP-PPase superfamily)
MLKKVLVAKVQTTQGDVKKLAEMLLMQLELNDSINGDNWEKTNLTHEGRDLDWDLCTIQETSEMIDSLNWKHWKDLNAPNDWENVKMELTDIWHFLLSKALTKSHSIVLEDLQPRTRINSVGLSEEVRVRNIINLSKELVHLSSKNDTSMLASETRSHILSLFNIYYKLLGEANLTFGKLYQTYRSKNVLNIFRQKNGYKEGTYVKLWDGVREDNQFLMEILEQEPNLNVLELLQKLGEVYLYEKKKL